MKWTSRRSDAALSEMAGHDIGDNNRILDRNPVTGLGTPNAANLLPELAKRS